MATLLVTHATAARPVPLAAACLVGRAPGCLVRMDDPAVPSHWLELRWAEGAWRWRALAGVARTRGVGMLEDDGWRSLPPSTPGRPQRVRLDDLVSVELLEGGAPETFVQDLLSGQVLCGDAIGAVAELRADGALVPFSDDDAPPASLPDGAVFVHDGRPWRVFLAASPEPTRRVRIDLARAGASVDVDPDRLRATLHQGDADVTIDGEHVRALVTYALARREDPEGGWLSAGDAWARWRALGGNPQSPVDRMGWDRGRVRAHLARLGVGGVEGLFESRRRHGLPEVRLALRVE